MSDSQPRRRLPRMLVALLVLGLGGLAGFFLGSALYPAPRAAALVWDDYIVAVAALYQRDGDLERARERLAELPTDDPAGSVISLATVYLPEPGGETDAMALRNLATALGGTGLPMAGGQPNPKQATGDQWQSILLSIARDERVWLGLGLVSAGWLGLVTAADRRARPPAGEKTAPAAPRPRRAPSNRKSENPPTAPAAVPTPTAERGATRSGVTHSPTTSVIAPMSFTYSGGIEPYEEVSAVADRRTRTLLAGCGIASGPAHPKAPGGVLGFAVWLHDAAPGEPPQTVALVTDGAVERFATVLEEWLQRVRPDQVVALQPGRVANLSTRRLDVAFIADELRLVRQGKRKPAAVSALKLRLEVSLGGRNAAGTGD